MNDTNKDFYDEFRKVYEDMKKNNKAPWLQEGVPVRGIAYNPKSGIIFKGLNSLILEMKAALNGYKDSRWLSSTELARLGVKIKAGEKSTPIAYSAQKKDFGIGNTKERYYCMFNVEQLSSLTLKNDRDFIVRKETTREKIQDTIKKTRTNDFSTIKNQLTKDSSKSSSNEMRAFIAVVSSYRLAQEFHIAHNVELNDDQKKALLTQSIPQKNLLPMMASIERTKDRFIAKDISITKTQNRQTERSPKNKGMEL